MSDTECGATHTHDDCWNTRDCKYAALKASHAELVEALRVAEWAMNYLGDQLNDIDAAFDDPELNRVSNAFTKVTEALKKAEAL